MTREIKFRAWDLNLKKMFYNIGFVWSDVGVRFFSEQPMVGSCIQWLPEEVEIMQSTGLFDKTGKEIYKGDLIKVREIDKGVKWIDAASEVKFMNGAFVVKWFERYAYLNELKTLEIMGNRFSNPEFLKEES